MGTKTTNKTIYIPPQYTQVHKDLMEYNGTFGLILNIRSAFLRYGQLTDKQWLAVQKCLAPQPVYDPNVTLVPKCHIPIVITPSSARYIARQNKWPMNPCTLLVTQILHVSRGVYKLKVKMDWSGTVSMCRCCGRSLKDWRSQATGVGPICVKGTNVKYVTDRTDVARFQKEMELLCDNVGEVVVDIKKWGFVDGVVDIDRAIAAMTAPPPPSQNTIHKCLLNMFDWNESTRVLTPKSWGKIPVDCTTIMVHNPTTGKSVEFHKQSKGVWWSKQDNLDLISIIE